MKKTFHIAKANARRNKGAIVPLFIIIVIIAALSTISASLFANLQDDFISTTERMNSAHNIFVMPRGQFNSTYADIIENDPRVIGFEQREVLFAGGATVTFGPTTETNVIIGNITDRFNISAPHMVERDTSIPREHAIYLPLIGEFFGYEIGGDFTMIHRNREITLIVAGFFEASEMTLPDMAAVKVYVPPEGYNRLSRYLGRSIWMAVRLHDLTDAEQFSADINLQFAEPLNLMSNDHFIMDIGQNINSIQLTLLLAGIILLFAIILIAISLMVIRFRVANSIENTMHEIGVLKAQGYTSRQIFACYITEYGLITAFAAIIGACLAPLAFPFVRHLFFTMSGLPWAFGASFAAGVLSVIFITLILLLMVVLSTRRIKKLPPIVALRGGMATNNFRRNFFPLKRLVGNIHFTLGLKNMFAYIKMYLMIGAVIAGAAFAATAMVAVYQNFVIDPTPLFSISGAEAHEMSITVTRHTDALLFAEELEQKPEVRMTLINEFVQFAINDVDVPFVQVSNDFTRFETIVPSDGRLPIHPNEVAMPLNLAQRIGITIGDSVRITAMGVTQEYIVTGHFPILGGLPAAAVTIDGYRRLNPNYAPRTIAVYFNEGVDFYEFSDVLINSFGMLNVTRAYEDDNFAAARARAEERIAFYLEYFGITSVEYAVLLDGEIIISGSSEDFKIERLTDNLSVLVASVDGLAAPFGLLTQLILVVSVIVISLILSVTVRSIVAKRRHELGILKSSGYTTKQLVRQMAVSFMPITTIGIVLGCFSGMLAVGPMLSVVIAPGFTIALTITPVIIGILCGMFMAVTYVVAYLSARSIKNISVYELLVE